MVNFFKKKLVMLGQEGDFYGFDPNCIYVEGSSIKVNLFSSKLTQNTNALLHTNEECMQ